MAVDISQFSPDLQEAYRRLLEVYGGTLPAIKSGYRDPATNKSVGGAKGSQHLHGNAIDWATSGMSQEERLNFLNAARQAGFQGFGGYSSGNVHTDVGPARYWGDDYSGKSAPDWLKSWYSGAQPESATRKTDMSMNPNAPQRTGLLGFFDLMREQDPNTGMTAMERFGAALDPLVAPEQRMGEQFRASGAQRLQTQSRNKTISVLMQRAQSGDKLAAMVLQGLQTGAFDAKTAMATYMSQMMKGNISQSDLNKMVVDARKEFVGLEPVKDFSNVSFAYSRVIRSADNPSPAGDLALIFNFMKVLDPGSVVREGEFATAQNAGGIDERLRSLYNQVVEGTRLTEAQRADFVDRATKLYSGAQEQYKSISDQYTDFAKRAGLDPSLVIPDFSFKGSVPEKPTILQVPANPDKSRFPTDAEWKNHWQNVMTEQDRKEYLEG